MSKVHVLFALPMMITLLACGAAPHPTTIEIGNPWNSIPTADYATASFSLGHVDTVTRGDTGTESLSHVALPYGVTINGGKLYVAEDTGRVKIWNSLTGASGQAADHFFGQTSATTTVLSTASSSSLRDPRGVSIVGERMAITDTGFNRILFVPFTREH